MNFSEEHSKFLAHYQYLVFNEKLQSGLPADRAYILRKTLAHLQYAECSNLLDDSVIRYLQGQYEDMYAGVVDSFDEKSGLNNYAEGALALCSGNRNESQKWQSCLSLDKISSLSTVQKSISASKAYKENHLPTSRMHQLLPSSKKGNRLTISKQNVQTNCTSNQQVSTKTELLNQLENRIINLYGNHEANVNQGADILDLRSCNSVDTYTTFNSSEDLKPNNRQSLLLPDDDGVRDGIQAHNSYGSNQLCRNVSGAKRTYNQIDEENEDTWQPNPTTNIFRTARQQMDLANQRKYGGGGVQSKGPVNTAAYGTGKKSLGTRRGLNSRFVPPVINREEEDLGNRLGTKITKMVSKPGSSNISAGINGENNAENFVDEHLKCLEPKMVELIMNEIMDNGPPVAWDDVAGLEFAKKTIKEIVVWPMLRPDIFTGLRGPPKGLLLFGPPGTGKTLIGKCIASQSKSTFFCISASSLTSKWVGEGEKMVRALFAVARSRQPAVVFIDEIDSLLTQRTDGENEASRRIKTEFLVQLDGASTDAEDRLLVVGATNRPQEIDEAARRRFVKRLYIPLPESPARRIIITNLLRQQSYHLSDEQLTVICSQTDGFSGSDMANLCREAALGPIRDMSFGDIENIAADKVRPITYEDFEDALQHVKPSVSNKDLNVFIEWNNTFGSGGR